MATKAKDKRKIDREIGQTLFNDTERFEMWFAGNWRKLTIVSVAAAAVIAVIFGINSWREAGNRKAAAAFADAVDAAALSAAVEANSDRPGVQLARFRLAGMHMTAGKDDAAIKELKAIIADAGCDPSLRGKAQLTAAYLLEKSGNLKDAVVEFTSAFNNTSLAIAIRAEAGTAAGRLYIKLKRNKEAADVLRRAGDMKADGMAGSYWSSSAKELLLALESGEIK